MMHEQHAIGLWHLFASGGGGMLATVALVWRMWVMPAHKRETDLQVRLALIEGRLDGHSKKDDAILEKLDKIEERLRALETAFAGVAPALKAE